MAFADGARTDTEARLLVPAWGFLGFLGSRTLDPNAAQLHVGVL